MSGLDLSIVGAFILYAIWSGLRSRKLASKNLVEYFLAGRQLNGWQAGISMAATQFAADTPLLVTGLVASAGIFALWRLWIYALAFLLMGFLLAACWRRAGVLTDAEFTELRYQGKAAVFLRGFKAVYFGLVFNCTVLAMVMLAATRIAEPFLLWNEWLPGNLYSWVLSLVQWVGVPFTSLPVEGLELWTTSANNLITIVSLALVTLFYSTTGGLRSVVRTDMLQFGLAMIATLAYAIVIIAHVGGLDELYLRLSEIYSASSAPLSLEQLLAFEWTQAKDAGFFLLLAFGIQWIAQINSDGTGYLAQRSMACKTDKDARLAAVVFTVAQILFRSLFWIAIALGLIAVFPPDFSLSSEAFIATREGSFINGILELLPSGVRGLMVTGMLAALVSTVDTHLNWGSSYFTNDLYKRFFCPLILKREASPKSLVWVARASNALILFVAFIIMANLSSIQQAWKLSLLIGAGVGIILVLRWMWWRVNAWAELGCTLTTAALAPFAIFLVPDEYDSLRLLVVTLIATSVAVLISVFRRPESPEVLKTFYERVQPPGLWKPVAERLGMDPELPMRKLKKGFTLVFLCSMSIFCLLTGIGSSLFGGTPPAWLPYKGLWDYGLIVVGMGLIPLIYRGISKPKENIIP